MNEQLTATQVTEVLGIAKSSVAKSMSRAAIPTRMDQRDPIDKRIKMTYDGKAVRELAEARRTQTCETCGGKVANNAQVTCGRPVCQATRRAKMNAIKSQEARNERRLSRMRRPKNMNEPRADSQAQVKITNSWNKTAGNTRSERLRITAAANHCNIATVLSVLKAMGEG